MAEEVKSVGQLIWNLAQRTAQAQARTLDRYTDFWLRLGKGEVSLSAASVDSARFAAEETARYARDLIVLSLSYYDTLLDRGRDYNDTLFSRVLGEEPSSNGQAPTTATDAATIVGARKVELSIVAPAGEEATGSFVLENKGADSTDVSFLVSDFGTDGEAKSFRGDITFSPERLTLQSGEERVITLRLPLKGDNFVPGHHYSATVVVRGYDNLELQLNVYVEERADTKVSEGDPASVSHVTSGDA